MPITTAFCSVALRDMMRADINLDTGGDQVNLALFTSSATLNGTTTAYTTSNETSGTGYTAGGVTLTKNGVTLSGSVAFADYEDVTFSNSSFTSGGCQIYSVTNNNSSISVHSFGADVPVVNGSFVITFPTPDASNAVQRLQG